MAATRSVTASEKTSVAGVAVEVGSRSTADDRSSGAVYSRVTAESVLGVNGGLGWVDVGRSWEEEKSIRMGV